MATFDRALKCIALKRLLFATAELMNNPEYDIATTIDFIARKMSYEHDIPHKKIADYLESQSRGFGIGGTR